MKKEVWKPYPEYPFIQGNRLGEVRTIDHYVTGSRGGKRLIKGHILKQHRNNIGYMRVHFSSNGKQVNRSVHRIIASCFLPNPDNLPEVNHKDCDPTNNCIDNLEWCTHEYNTEYREKYGTALNHPVIAINLATQEPSLFPLQCEAGRELGISPKSINQVVRNKRKTTHGYWFTYADKSAVESTRRKFGDEVAREVEQLMSENELQPA